MKTVITGAAMGIGRACALALRKEGHSVIGLDVRGPERVDGIEHYLCDITDPTSVEAAVKKIDGSVDCLILNAGIMVRGSILDVTHDQLTSLLNVNVIGAWNVCRALRSRLVEGSQIVIIASAHVLRPERDPGAYILSKMALTNLGKLLELSLNGIRVKFVFPGPIDTTLAYDGLLAEDAVAKREIVIPPATPALQIAELVAGESSTLSFDPSIWSHVMG